MATMPQSSQLPNLAATSLGDPPGDPPGDPLDNPPVNLLADPLATPLPPPVPTLEPSIENAADEFQQVMPPQPALSFFQQPWVQNVLPFATSVAVHLAIVIVVLTAFTAVGRVTQAVKEQILVPDTNLVNDAPVGGIQNPGLGSDPNRASGQDKVEVADASSTSDKKTESLSRSLMESTAAESSTDNMIGLGPHASISTGVGKAPTVDDDRSEQLSPYGVPGGANSAGPKSPFMGISGNAHTVVYVCDASGSMLTKMVQLKEQLRTAVSKLQPVQSFSVIFFADTRPMALSTSLLIANPDNKLKFEKYLTDVRAIGSTDPIPGLDLAFRMHPQLIYLLTDGDFEDNKKVLEKIKSLQAQANPKVKINTIVFTDPLKADKGIVELLRKIADDSGGQPLVKSPDDF